MRHFATVPNAITEYHQMRSHRKIKQRRADTEKEQSAHTVPMLRDDYVCTEKIIVLGLLKTLHISQIVMRRMPIILVNKMNCRGCGRKRV
jgi:hypothetical protein